MSIFNRHVQPGTGRTLTDAEFLGLGFTVAAAALSALSVLALLAHIFRRISTIRYNLRLGRYCYLQVFFLSLLLSDLLLSVGTLISIMWILDGGVSEGPLCTAQAIIRQAGQLGVAWATLAITIGTWGIIVRGWSQLSGQHVILPYTGIWIFIITLSPLLLVIPRDQPFFGKTNYWCWIRPSGGLRDAMAFNIGWVWFCAFVNLIAYISAASSVLSKGATLRGEVSSRLLGSGRANEHKSRLDALSVSARPSDFIHHLVYVIVHVVRILERGIVYDHKTESHPKKSRN
ncbi:hypothetical protein SISSUDRAFT_1065796 [Sistotremastrum suecicum HHB10207 ss-3]|uniref:Glucose receptor Git3 N-terminal domain-containing protein n=1 Tax=Sistotremastrum suecicum HHB10207 ss-3 TaxID=1314776 RepID=A0A165Z223_9AGAM|nr:hypothetical protein SISSUDRAFT_1065796 [Sistotremastrum suecicum HHB10207 ss-3]